MKHKFELETLVNKIKTNKSGVIPIEFGVGGKSLYGMFDLDNHRLVRDFEFTYIDPTFIDGLAMVSTNGEEFGVIKSDGSFFIEPSKEYNNIWIHESGVIVIESKNGQIKLVSTKSQKLLSPFLFSDVDFIWEDKMFAAIKVTIKNEVGEEYIGLIRNDGMKLSDMRYNRVDVCTADGYIILSDNGTNSVLIDVAEGKNIISGGTICKFTCSKLAFTQETDNVCSLIALKDHEIYTHINGFKAYLRLTNDLIICIKEAYRSVFSLSKNKFVLEEIDDSDRIIAESVDRRNYDARSDVFRFKTLKGLYGIASAEGDILVEPNAKQISSRFGSSDILININDFFGVWNAESKKWIVEPIYKKVEYMDSCGLYLTTSIEFGMLKKTVFRFFDNEGKLVFGEPFLNLRMVGLMGEYKAKTFSGKWRDLDLWKKL